MTELDQHVAKTQTNVTYGYMTMFLICLVALLFLPKPLDDFTKTLLTSLLSVLGTLITQQSSFWMARQRTAGVPDPGPPQQVGPVARVDHMHVDAPKPTAESEKP